MIEAHTTMPPKGKHCSRCLCCDAVLIFDGEALCAACDDGTHAPPGLLASPIEEKAFSLATALGATEVHLCPEPKSLKENTMKPELLRAIRESDPSDSCRIVGKRLGVAQSVVQYYRTKQSRESGAAKAPKSGKAAARAKAASKPIGNAIQRAAQVVDSWPVTIKVNQLQLDAWWMQLSLESKANLFAGNYVIGLEGTVS